MSSALVASNVRDQNQRRLSTEPADSPPTKPRSAQVQLASRLCGDGARGISPTSTPPAITRTTAGEVGPSRSVHQHGFSLVKKKEEKRRGHREGEFEVRHPLGKFRPLHSTLLRVASPSTRILSLLLFDYPFARRASRRWRVRMEMLYGSAKCLNQNLCRPKLK